MQQHKLDVMQMQLRVAFAKEADAEAWKRKLEMLKHMLNLQIKLKNKGEKHDNVKWTCDK